MTIDKAFERELEIFRKEAESAAQFFYSELAMREVARRHKHVFRMLNDHPLFWSTIMGGLQTAALIALGRIFDQQSRHNLDRLVRLAQDNITIFSKPALAKRRQGNAPQPPAWLPDFLLHTHEATPTDLRRLRRHVAKYRSIYQRNYRDLRNQYYAHKDAADDAAVAVLVAKTNIREMQRLFVFLLQLHQAFLELFLNGRRPILRPVRYSAKRMRDRPSGSVHGSGVQERITRQAEEALLAVAGLAKLHKKSR